MRSIRPLFRTALLLTSCALAARTARAQEDLSALWRDPAFVRSFLGSYGVNAEIEPRLMPDEVKLLERIRPLLEKNDQAGAEAELVKRMQPDCSASLDMTLGTLRYQQEKFAEARASYERAVEKFPSFRRAWRNLGLIHARDGRHDEAIRAFTRMLELGGGDAYSYGLLGFAYSAKEDYQASEAAYRNALLLQPDNTDWRFGVTKCAFKQEKYEDAATMLAVLLERFPDKAEFWALQASAFVGLKQPLRAAQDLEIVDRLGKASVEQLSTLGDLYAGEGLLELALSAYRRALERDTGPGLARHLRAAEVLASRAGTGEARALVARMRERSPAPSDEGERRTLLKLDARLALASGAGGEEAARVLEEIVALDPLDGEALLLLGQHHVARSEPDRALFYFERAASLEACEVQARIRQAQVLVGLERYGEALPHLRRAQELRPREDVARYLEGVERLARTRR